MKSNFAILFEPKVECKSNQNFLFTFAAELKKNQTILSVWSANISIYNEITAPSIVNDLSQKILAS